MAIDVNTLSGSTAPLDMSFMGLFMQADMVVKGVMLLLALGSLWSWAIIIEKWFLSRRVRFLSQRFQDNFWSSDDLEACYEKTRKKPNHPMARVFLAGMEEWHASTVGAEVDENQQESFLTRLRQIMQVAVNREMDELEKSMGFLATIGSTAPFVGLFGTVWGIMASFQAIAVHQNTSLAVVAPGIAEALLATAIGLFVAIPAVMFFNRFSSEMSNIHGVLEDFSTEFGALLSRQMDGDRSRGDSGGASTRSKRKAA